MLVGKKANMVGEPEVQGLAFHLSFSRIQGVFVLFCFMLRYILNEEGGAIY